MLDSEFLRSLGIREELLPASSSLQELLTDAASDQQLLQVAENNALPAEESNLDHTAKKRLVF